MSTAAFREWVKAGRHWQLAKPIAEYAAQLKAAGWTGGLLGTIGDEAHLTAETPQDHTPFSVTGWPQGSPYGYVHALDVTHRPILGLNVFSLVEYWLEQARGGMTPWVKYIIWQSKRYDTRNGWNPVAAQGHTTHAHLSIRSDYTHQSIGSWPVTRNGETVDTNAIARAVLDAILEQGPVGTEHAGHMLRTAIGHTWATADRIEAGQTAVLEALRALQDRPTATVDPQALAEALAASEAFTAALADAVADRVTGLVSPVDIAQTFGRALLAAQES